MDYITPLVVLKPAGLKDDKETQTKNSDKAEIVQDAETKTKSENVEVKNDEVSYQISTEQAVNTVDESPNINKEVKNSDEKVNNKEG